MDDNVLIESVAEVLKGVKADLEIADVHSETRLQASLDEKIESVRDDMRVAGEQSAQSEKSLAESIESAGEDIRKAKEALEAADAHVEDRLQNELAKAVDSLRTDMKIRGELSAQTEKTITNLEDQVAQVGDHVKSALSAQRADLDAQRAALEERIDSKVKHLDGTELLKSEIVKQQESDVSAMRLYLANLGRKSERVSSTGTPSKLLQKAIEGVTR